MLSKFKVLFFCLIVLTAGSFVAYAQVVIDFSSDYFNNVYGGRNNVLMKEIEILNKLDNLSMILLDSKINTGSHIDNLTEEVMALTELSAKNIRDAIPVKSGLENVVTDSDTNMKRPFKGFSTQSLTDKMLEVLKDSGVYKASKKEINELKKKNNEFDNRLENIISEYTKLWIRDIKSGDEYNKVLSDYRKLVKDIINLNIKFYESKTRVADKKMLDKLEKVKHNVIEKEIKKRLDKAEENQKKLDKFNKK